MNKIRLFQFMVVVSTAIYVVWFFLPQWPSVLPNPEYRLDEISGFGAILPIHHPIYYGTWFVLWIIAALALLFFQNWARFLYLVLSVLSVIVTPFSGFSVQGPLDNFFSYVSALLDGAILAMAYYSPLAKNFEKNVNRKK